MNNSKKNIYKNVIIKALEEIKSSGSGQNVDILKMINESINCKSLQIQYDAEFYNSLANYYMKLDCINTKDQEYVLYELLNLCQEQKVILTDQSRALNEQITHLFNLREFYKKIRENKSNILDSLKETYDQAEEGLGIEELLNKFEDSKNKLNMDIEKVIKDLDRKQIESEIKRQSNFNQPNNNNIKNKENFDEILQKIYEEQKMEKSSQSILLQEVDFIRKIVGMMKLKKLFNLDYVTIQPYGSIVSGFAQKSSDIDVSINTNCYIEEKPFLELLNNFIVSYCTQNNKQVTTKVIINAKTPLLQYQRKTFVDNQEVKVDIDICINNILGCNNSRMLYTLSCIHDKIVQLGIVIKYWAKQRGISNKDNLSSYSLILMMFCFLFKRKFLNSTFVQESLKKEKAIFVKIKRIRDANEEIFDTNLYFYDDIDRLKRKLKESAEKNKEQTLDEIPLSQLFTKFIQFYQNKCLGNRFISIFHFDKDVQDKTYDYDLYDQNNYFNIEDPFDRKHNPGQKSNKKQQLFEDAFDNALKQIQDQQYQLLFTKKGNN